MPDLTLTEEERMLQSTVREFADRELAPRAKEVDQKEEFSWENWNGMAALGLMGIGIDSAYGGNGSGGFRHVAIVAEEVARGDASASVSLLAHLSLGTTTIARFGNEEQKKRLVPPLATGKGRSYFSLNFWCDFTLSTLTPTTTAFFSWTRPMLSRKLQASLVHPGVSSLG